MHCVALATLGLLTMLPWVARGNVGDHGFGNYDGLDDPNALDPNNKNPLESCDIFYTKCQGNSHCAITSYYQQYFGRCLCADGFVLDAEKHICRNCTDAAGGFPCGANAACVKDEAFDPYITEIYRCQCDVGFVADINSTEGACVKCDPSRLGVEQSCGPVGNCVITDGTALDDMAEETPRGCQCYAGYIEDGFVRSCRACNERLVPVNKDECVDLNAVCEYSLEAQRYKCLCEFGNYTWNAGNTSCVRCTIDEPVAENRAYCPQGQTCVAPLNYEDGRTLCYKLCNPTWVVDPCNNGQTSQICTPSVDAIWHMSNRNRVCECQEGYERSRDGTCIPTGNRLTCYTCEHGDHKCNEIQDTSKNFYKLCEYDEVCYTEMLHWVEDEGGTGVEGSTLRWSYRRDCRKDPCDWINPITDCVDVGGRLHCEWCIWFGPQKQCLSCCEDPLCNWYELDRGGSQPIRGHQLGVVYLVVMVAVVIHS